MVEYFIPIISQLFCVEDISRIGEDDLTKIETFRRTPTADLQVKLNQQLVCIEIQSGFQGINDIKEHKVRQAHRVKEEKKIPTICIHVDLFNGQVAFVRLDVIDMTDVNWVTRQQMEGQSVLAIDQNYFKWRLLDELPTIESLELGV